MMGFFAKRKKEKNKRKKNGTRTSANCKVISIDISTSSTDNKRYGKSVKINPGFSTTNTKG